MLSNLSSQSRLNPIGLSISACAFLLYYWTAAPTLTWGGGDSAKLAIWVFQGEVGYAPESHPLYVILGRIFAWLPLGGDLAYRLNLFSAFCSGLAVYAMFLITRRMAGTDFPAACASSALALSHTFWLHAVITEVYALHILFLLVTLGSFLRWAGSGESLYLYLASGLFGAGVSNHILMTWAVPGIIYLLISHRRELRTRLVIGSLASCCLGLSPLIFAWIQGAQTSGFLETLRVAAGIGYAGSLNFQGGRLPLYLAYLFYQFPVVGFALGWIGLPWLIRRNRPAFLALTLSGIPYLLFPLMWDFRDHYQFALSFYACFAALIAPGVCALRERLTRGALTPLALLLLIAFPLSTYATTPFLSRAFGIDLVKARTLPYRDNASYFLNPSKRGDDGARRYASETLKILAPNAVIVGDYTPALVMTYLQDVEGLRPDIRIYYTSHVKEQLRLISEWIDHRPVYVATLETRGLPSDLYLRRESLLPDYEAIPTPPVFRIEKGSPDSRLPSEF